MRFFGCLVLFSLIFDGLSQQSVRLIPKEAVAVFSLNSENLFQKISVDDLIRYDFMEEIHQELFDGSTNGKTLKDAGIDFNQNFNIFYGKDKQYEVSGFSFGIKDQQQLFAVFDDFELVYTLEGSRVFGSFLNNLVIHNNDALLIRVEPLMAYVDKVTDSLWYAQGNESPFPNSYEENEGIFEEQEFEESDELPPDYFPDAFDDPNTKNYYEFRDSVESSIHKYFVDSLMQDLFVKKISLLSVDKNFKEQIEHTSEGIFFMDNSRNLDKANGLWYFQTILPTLYRDIKEIYDGNIILGDLTLFENSIEFDFNALYGEKLGSIYREMTDSKFDKNVLRYIPKTSTGYFTYSINLRKAYEKAYEVIMPILEDEKNAQIAMNVLTIELLNEFINKDALFDTYKGSMFGSFNGIKKVKTKKIDFSYDEETFEYSERISEAMEDMPIFTIGFTTKRADIPEKVLKHLSRLTSQLKKEDDYWCFQNAILDAAPLYMVNKNGLFIFSNDIDFAKNYSEGYGSEALSVKSKKAIKKSGFMYANFDLNETINRLPSDFFSARQDKFIEAFKGKTGKMELISTEINKNNTKLKLKYTFDSIDKSGKHLLDLINILYVLGK
ncbi:MAG: hypothetical protein FJX80_05390 [Bacteroidetes bacterium]|nr:hypothetical protein [Bacteroidota bacterium]